MKASLSIDGLSLSFILLTILLIPTCILSSWSSIKAYHQGYLALFLLLECQLILVFCVTDLLQFYILFESVLIPMYLMVGIWGSRSRKILAAYRLLLFTILGSVLMLLAILSIYYQVGTTDGLVLMSMEWSTHREMFLWMALLLAFMVKIPMVPLHLWLPEAHVEASTAGSIVLAGVLLKLGTYGMVRFLLAMIPTGLEFYRPGMITLSLLGMIHAGLTTLRQVDMKKIIAYASIGHMSMVVLGILSGTLTGLIGATSMMLAHGIVSGGLFASIGVVYERTHTRILHYYGGIVTLMPLFIVLMLVFVLANIALPGTVAFMGELLLLAGIFLSHPGIATLAGLGMFLCTCYTLWMFNRMSFGSISGNNSDIDCNSSNVLLEDVTLREFHGLGFLAFLTLWLGIQPYTYFGIFEVSLNRIMAAVLV